MVVIRRLVVRCGGARATGRPLIGLSASLNSERGSESSDEIPREWLLRAECVGEGRGEALGRIGLSVSPDTTGIIGCST